MFDPRIEEPWNPNKVCSLAKGANFLVLVKVLWLRKMLPREKAA